MADFEIAPVGTAAELAQVKAERDALAAHVELLREAGAELAHLMDGVREGDYKPDSFTNQPMQIALSETSTDSIPRLKAEWQAEAMEGWLEQVRYMEGLNTFDCIESAELYAEELRRQAEEI